MFELAQLRTKIGEVVAAFRQEAAHVRAANEYSEIGKRRNLATLADSHVSRLDMFGPYIDGCRTTLREERAKLTLKAAGGDSATTAILHREIRDNLPEDGLEVKQILQEAIRNSEQDVFDAIRLAPTFMRRLPAEDISEAEVSWQAMRDPKRGQYLRDLADALVVVEQVLASARKAIASEGGIGTKDPLEAVAEGGE